MHGDVDLSSGFLCGPFGSTMMQVPEQPLGRADFICVFVHRGRHYASFIFNRDLGNDLVNESIETFDHAGLGVLIGGDGILELRLLPVF
jgi:hypothetical protein